MSRPNLDYPEYDFDFEEQNDLTDEELDEEPEVGFNPSWEDLDDFSYIDDVDDF